MLLLRRSETCISPLELLLGLLVLLGFLGLLVFLGKEIYLRALKF